MLEMTRMMSSGIRLERAGRVVWDEGGHDGGEGGGGVDKDSVALGGRQILRRRTAAISSQPITGAAQGKSATHQRSAAFTR